MASVKLVRFNNKLKWRSKAETGIGIGDTDKFVVFSDTFGARKGTSLDLAGTEADGKVRDANVFSFAGTM